MVFGRMRVCWVELGVGLDGAGWVSLAKVQQKVDAEG